MSPFKKNHIVKDKSIRAKSDQCLLEIGDGMRVLNAKGYDGNFGGDGNTIHLNCGGIYMIV